MKTKTNNLKVSLFGIEKVQPGVVYSFNYNPEKQYFEKLPHIRMNYIDEDFRKITKHLEEEVLFHLRMEISPMGRFHYHGKIKFKTETPIYFYSNGVREFASKGSLKIDTISDMDVWEDYMCKQLHIFPEDKYPYSTYLSKDYAALEEKKILYQDLDDYLKDTHQDGGYEEEE